MNREEFIREIEANATNDVDIVMAKNADYANGDDPFQNFRLVAAMGTCTVEQGILVRMSDKMQRIANLLTREAEVKDESIADTLSDLRNYANILQIYINYIKEKDLK